MESLYQQAENNGIEVENYSLPTTRSLMVCLGGKYYIGIDRSRMDNSREEAECLAHEMGHCRTAATYRPGERRRRRYERRAEEWAIRRIVPKSHFQQALRRGCREVWELAEELDISCSFAEKVMAYYLKQS